MTRSTLLAMAVLLGIAPIAQAQAVNCRQRLDELSKQMNGVIDAKTKQNAATERSKAEQEMARNNEAGCMNHAEAGLNMMHGD